MWMRSFRPRLILLSTLCSLAILSGCDDGDDGAQGPQGPPGPTGPTGPSAPIPGETLIGVDTATVSGDILTVTFSATDSANTPIVGLSSIKIDSAQLMPAMDGNSSMWQKLASERCDLNGDCPGTLTDNQDGTYQYAMATTLSAGGTSLDPSYTQHTTLRIIFGDEQPDVYSSFQYKVDGSEVTDTRLIIDDASCLRCHDGIDSIFHGGDNLANCATCHTTNNVSEGKDWTTLAHSAHIGVSPEPVGNCLACHTNEITETLPQALNWESMPNRENCSTCHALPNDTASNKLDHSGFDNSQCTLCHTTEVVHEDHLGAIETAQAEAERSIVLVDVVDAKLTEVAGEMYADISFALINKAGERITMPNDNPADAEWIKNLQMYVNWGTSVDFTTSRGWSIFVKSNKKDITGDDPYDCTPTGERARTPLYSAQDNVFTYRQGPIVTADNISGDLIDDAGFISNRLIYCFDSEQNLVSCDSAGHKKNTAWNERWYFNKSGLTSDESAKRRHVVSNENCGSCHGYEELYDNTQLACRNCHSRNTERNAIFADTTCYSGHDDDDMGNHIRPYEERPTQARKKAGFISSTADVVDPCTACHNPNTPPTQAIREYHTNPSDPYYIERLTVTHPDHKVWMHSLHTNQRATQEEVVEGSIGIRNVEYPADPANCYRCHDGDTFGVDYLTEKGRPLALDLDYDLDSDAHPAIDITVDAYVSPVSAACYSCHARTEGADGKKVFNGAVKSHMEQNGGRFGVPLNQIEVEACAVCHDLDNLKKVHNLN